MNELLKTGTQTAGYLGMEFALGSLFLRGPQVGPKWLVAQEPDLLNH